MFTNWKTTLFGFLAGAVTFVGSYLESGQFSWKALLAGAVMAGWGAVQKDMNVTGGTVAQTPEAERRT